MMESDIVKNICRRLQPSFHFQSPSRCFYFNKDPHRWNIYLILHFYLTSSLKTENVAIQNIQSLAYCFQMYVWWNTRECGQKHSLYTWLMIFSYTSILMLKVYNEQNRCFGKIFGSYLQEIATLNLTSKTPLVVSVLSDSSSLSKL